MKVKLELYGASRDLSEKNFIEFNLDKKSSSLTFIIKKYFLKI